jgi:hypothetical protein
MSKTNSLKKNLFLGLFHLLIRVKRNEWYCIRLGQIPCDSMHLNQKTVWVEWSGVGLGVGWRRPGRRVLISWTRARSLGHWRSSFPPTDRSQDPPWYSYCLHWWSQHFFFPSPPNHAIESTTAAAILTLWIDSWMLVEQCRAKEEPAQPTLFLLLRFR